MAMPLKSQVCSIAAAHVKIKRIRLRARAASLSLAANQTMAKLNSTGRRGLLAGGNWIIDQVKIIDVYPQPEQLGNIRSQSQGTGGAPYNVLIDLANSGAPFPLMAAGLVGEDELGDQILTDCRKHDID